MIYYWSVDGQGNSNYLLSARTLICYSGLTLAHGSVFLAQFPRFACFSSLTIFLVFPIGSIFNIVLISIIICINTMFSFIFFRLKKSHRPYLIMSYPVMLSYVYWLPDQISPCL